MKREDIKKFFPDATEEQLKGLLDINTADIGKAKGELEAVKADLEKANGTLREYETTIADLKKSAEGNEDFKEIREFGTADCGRESRGGEESQGRRGRSRIFQPL
ncbi:MAG: hypothetical protein ACLUPD_10515 [Anaerotignum faecicola]